MYEITEKRISIDSLIRNVKNPGAGCMVLFIGTVRDHSREREVVRLDYEAYDDMAEKLLREIASQAEKKYKLLKTGIIHRTGSMEVGEIVLVIAVSAAHREEGFSGCRYILERIKQSLPVWKKELYVDGEAWIEETPVRE